MDKKFLQILTLATLSTLFTSGSVIAALDYACIARCDEGYEHCKNNIQPHYTSNQRESHISLCRDRHAACRLTCIIDVPLPDYPDF